MTTERLEEFVMLANLLNYSKAAERLFISQSVLSRHIKELEGDFGVPLFCRDTHSVTLTDEGRYLLKWARQLLEQAERAVSALNGEAGVQGEQLHILASEQCLSTHVLAFVRSFAANYPGIALHLSPLMGGSRRELIYTCDLFLSPCDFVDILRSDTEGTLLGKQQPLLAIPPQSRLGDMQKIELQDLRGESLVVPYAEEMFGPYARNAMAASRKCRGELHRLSAESPQAGLLQVELGAGVMLIPHHLKHRVYPLTRTIPVADPDCRFPIFAYWNKSRENPAAALFYGAMKRAFSAEN